MALRGYGADVLAVESTDTAIAMLTHGRFAPDVLVSDIGMPASDGYDLIRRVRNLSPGIRRIPAIAVTAYADSEDRIQALTAGYQLHLSKPIDPAFVASSISSLVAAALSQPKPKPDPDDRASRR